MKHFFQSLAGMIQRVPWWITVIAIVLSFIAIPGIISMRTEAGLSTLVSPNSDLNLDTQAYQKQFGGEPVSILLTGQLQDIFSADNLKAINQFEQSLSNYPGCRAVYSPVTILNQAIATANQQAQELQQQIAAAQDSAAQAAKQTVASQGGGTAEQEAAAQAARNQVLLQYQPYLDQFAKLGQPSLDNPIFISSVLYNSDKSINATMSSLVPDNEHALIFVTPQGNQTDSASVETLKTIESNLNAAKMNNVTALVVSDTSIMNAITSSLKSNMVLLLGLAVLVMVVILFVLFRVRWRLISLLMVGVGALWTFGLMGYISIPLSMATMAVLPILIGLGIDYPIQFHNRYQEEVTRSNSVKEAMRKTLSSMAPAVGVALIATIIGFITMYVSDIPMIRDFGTLLAVGVVLCYLVALFVMSSILYLGDRRVQIQKLGRASTEATGRMEKILHKISSATIKRPVLVISIAVFLGIVGGALDHWIPTNTDFEKLIPQDLPQLQDMRELRSILGVSGEIRFLVQADDVTSPAVINQLKSFQDQEQSKYKGLVSTSGIVTTIIQSNGGTIPDEKQIQNLVAKMPIQFSGQFVSSDRKMATMAFGLAQMSLQEVHDMINGMQEDSRGLKGVTVSPVGSMALGAGTVDSVVGTRLMMDLLCLAAIFIILLIIYRRFSRAIFIIIPVILVIGWSSLIMYIGGIALNPLTAILGVLTTAIGTEFVVLLASRYEEEKSLGKSPREAMLIATSKMGRAVVTTGLTTLGGFGVLIASNFVMIRDFGIITLIGIFLCIVSALVVMPPLMVWFDERRNQRKLVKTG